MPDGQFTKTALGAASQSATWVMAAPAEADGNNPTLVRQSHERQQRHQAGRRGRRPTAHRQASAATACGARVVFTA